MENKGQFTLMSEPGQARTPAQYCVRAIYDAGLSDETIATVINCSGQTINRIRHARVSGSYLEPRLRELFSLMQRSGALHDV